ncbi:CoA transferase [Acuticoccus sediminis]|uniref:CoA transferase n=1 Tax=Acuticoccus sediminis TaxID=2184697 RepID=A0A8B2NT03_9HYPH|nr:CoA transferase [Acuticoccus sediminis]RAI02061.1 CoA transferase [Acuticoccus sediminis]
MTMSGDTFEGALDGLRVVDFSQGVAGPNAAMMMARCGADVVKVEPPQGDWSRVLGESYGGDNPYAVTGNFGKRSVVLDMKTDEGLNAARRLAEGADIVVEAFRPGVMAKFGLDYATLATANPGLIMLSITGFGQTGPYRDLPATDTVLQAASGFMHLNADGTGRPRKLDLVIVDYLAGLHGFQMVLHSLLVRARTGRGRHLDCPLLQSAASIQAVKALEEHLRGGPPRMLYAPVGAFATSDGFVAVTVRLDSHFAALCRTLGCPDLVADERFATLELRVQNVAALDEALAPHFARWSRAELAAALADAGVLNAAVNDYAAYVSDPHVTAVGMLQWIDHPRLGPIPVTPTPGLPAFAPGAAHSASPTLGEHTREVLEELGLSQGATAGNDG